MKKTRLMREKGYILAYSAVVTAFAVTLVAAQIGMLKGTVSLGKVSAARFLSDIKFSQIEEYIISGEYHLAEYETAGSPFIMEFTLDSEGPVLIEEIRVYENGAPRLYCEKKGGEMVAYIYGKKP